MLAAVDGCRTGWVVALADDWPPREAPQLVICADFEGVLVATGTCLAVAVDMPIGLPSGSQPRRCDALGREKLGPAGAARLFYAPPRATLSADNPRTFQAIHRAICGKGAGLPVWGIMRKLREVDRAMTPEGQSRVCEFHPELAWQRLAGRTLESKHKPSGLAHRRALLAEVIPRVTELTARRQRGATPDDLLDALVGLAVVKALATGSGRARCLPPDHIEYDARGLRMEIWF